MIARLSSSKPISPIIDASSLVGDLMHVAEYLLEALENETMALPAMKVDAPFFLSEKKKSLIASYEEKLADVLSIHADIIEDVHFTQLVELCDLVQIAARHNAAALENAIHYNETMSRIIHVSARI